MLELCGSLQHSNKIINKLTEKLAEIKTPVDVYCFSNGREQGYYLQNVYDRKGLVFAEHRCSDALIVIFGNLTQFDNCTHHPSETAWRKNQRAFDNDDEAVNFILEKIL